MKGKNNCHITGLLGEKEIDNDRYYGIQTLRAKENFPISGQRVHPLIIKTRYIKSRSFDEL